LDGYELRDFSPDLVEKLRETSTLLGDHACLETVGRIGDLNWCITEKLRNLVTGPKCKALLRDLGQRAWRQSN